MDKSNHHPIQGASWMLIAGLAFAIVNSLVQVASINFGITSTTVAVIQYGIALIVIIPYLKTLGFRQSLRTERFGMHTFRVFLSVIGIQLWLWALAYPVPIWQGIALLMTSPLFATIGSGPVIQREGGCYALGGGTCWLYRRYDHFGTLVRRLWLGNTTSSRRSFLLGLLL